MTGIGLATDRAHSEPARSRRRRRALLTAALWLVVLGNAALMTWLWVRGGGLAHVDSAGALLTSLSRLTGLLGAYLALLQVLLLARIPWLERLAGLDRLSVWHRWNGHACLYLVLAHVVLVVWGYALLDRVTIPAEISTMLAGGVYPGMITATVGTVLLVAVVASSIVIVKRRLPYEAWYLVHLTAYAAIALAWFHQIPTGNELMVDEVAADYWRGLYLATLGLLLAYRVVLPTANAFRYRLRVTEVIPEGHGVVSLRITGRGLDRLRARAGQFFLWRFLDRRRWWGSHPFSLSEAPDGHSLRITVKALGDYSRDLASVRPGTRVAAEGPFGVFTDENRRRDRALLIGGGIGVAPVRALLEEAPPGTVAVVRALSDADVVFRDELEEIARERDAVIHVVTGDHETDGGRELLSPRHLRELVPDLVEREVYVCGPPGMTTAITAAVRSAGVPSRYVHAERFAL